MANDFPMCELHGRIQTECAVNHCSCVYADGKHKYYDVSGKKIHLCGEG
jgi:hypothetical protein